MPPLTHRIPEPEVMSDADEARAYRAADFSEVNRRFAERLAELWREAGSPGAARSGWGSRAAGPVMLDLGCGPADIPLRVRRLIPGCRIAAADASHAMMAEGVPARAAEGPAAVRELAMVRADARTLPFADGAFDAVFSNSLLHHLPDAAACGVVWAEVRRVARPGAVVFFRDLHRPPDTQTAAALVAQHAGGEPELLRTLFHNSLLAAFTVDEIRGQLSAAGLGGLSIAKVTDRHLDVWGTMAG
jgi:ubiquinone/menaquinone biosynthesis C-methylase UbiE